MDIMQLPTRPAGWNDLIQPYLTKTLFHESTWLDHIQSIYPGTVIEYFKITENSQIIGYFCALRLQKFFLSIYGSPLGGTGTEYMGPLVRNVTNHQLELISGLVDLCKKNKIIHFELCADWLDPALMETLGFVGHSNVTHLCVLPSDQESAWKSLKSTCRNRIRKAEKNQLVAELTDDPAIVDHYYSQCREVYAKQGMAVPYAKERPLSLFHHLLPADRLFPVWVRLGDKIIASGLFPHDNRCVYFWGGASWSSYHCLYPNEALHWTVMRLAISRNIPQYNMCGGESPFKNKFGGLDVPYITYSKSFSPCLGIARKAYRASHFYKLKLLGKLRRSKASA
ncbi:MAG: GNAT family N-acetyltransferase [Candidatus Tectomicrobia bacterium]|nr:GNAT family N-acetyltransferase [Candidatus Tectomicrobia bacterium]